VTRCFAQSQCDYRAHLPTDTELSEDNWKAEFEEWREKQEEDSDKRE
jgi:hypothetical protein